jgi:integrase
VIARELIAIAGSLPLHQLAEAHVTAITNRWLHDLRPNTRRTKTILLHQLLRELAAQGARPLNYAVPRKPRATPRTTIATAEELLALETRTPPWLRCFVLLCTQLGLRFAEAARACPAAWDREGHTLTCLTKGGNVRCIAVTPRLEELFKLAATTGDAATPFIFTLHGENARTGPHTGTPLRNPHKFIYPRWQRWKKKLGINPELNIHDLRRTAITGLYRATRDPLLAQQFAGHSSLATTAAYLAPYDSTHMLDAIRKAAAPQGGWKQ